MGSGSQELMRVDAGTILVSDALIVIYSSKYRDIFRPHCCFNYLVIINFHKISHRKNDLLYF